MAPRGSKNSGVAAVGEADVADAPVGPSADVPVSAAPAAAAPASASSPQAPEQEKKAAAPRQKKAPHKYPLPKPEATGSPFDVKMKTQMSTPLKKGGYPTSNKLGSSSKYLGVTWHDLTGKWSANFEKKYIGLYATEEDAAEARWQHALTKKEETPPVAAYSVTSFFKGEKPKLAAAPSKDVASVQDPASQPAKRKSRAKPMAEEPACKRSASQLFAAGSAARAPAASKAASGTSAGGVFQQLMGQTPAQAKLGAAKLGGKLAAKAKTKAKAKAAAAATAEKRPATQKPDDASAPAKKARQSTQKKVEAVGSDWTPEQKERLDRMIDATPEEEAQMKDVLHTFHKWLLTKGIKDATCMQYLRDCRLQYEEDRKSPTTMASAEYWNLIKLSAKNCRGGQRRSSAVSYFSEFHCGMEISKGAIEPSDDPMYRVRSRDDFSSRRNRATKPPTQEEKVVTTTLLSFTKAPAASASAEVSESNPNAPAESSSGAEALTAVIADAQEDATQPAGAAAGEAGVEAADLMPSVVEGPASEKGVSAEDTAATPSPCTTAMDVASASVESPTTSVENSSAHEGASQKVEGETAEIAPSSVTEQAPPVIPENEHTLGPAPMSPPSIQGSSERGVGMEVVVGTEAVAATPPPRSTSIDLATASAESLAESAETPEKSSVAAQAGASQKADDAMKLAPSSSFALEAASVLLAEAEPAAISV